MKRVALVWLICLSAGILHTGSALAATCAFAGTTATVTFAGNDSATVAVSGSSITMNGLACGAATTANTDFINTAGTVTGAETFVLDLSGGHPAPGAAPEAPGSPEIELRVDLGASNDVFGVIGTSGADLISLGSAGLNLNADDDADVVVLTVESVFVRTRAGNDIVSGIGSATGAAFRSQGDEIGAARADHAEGVIRSPEVDAGSHSGLPGPPAPPRVPGAHG